MILSYKLNEQNPYFHTLLYGETSNAYIHVTVDERAIKVFSYFSQKHIVGTH